MLGIISDEALIEHDPVTVEDPQLSANDSEEQTINDNISCVIMYLLVSFLLISIGFYSKINSTMNTDKLVYTLIGNAGFIVLVMITYMLIMMTALSNKAMIVRTVSIFVRLLGIFMIIWDLIIITSKN
jgi:hypothetical protein